MILKASLVLSFALCVLSYRRPVSEHKVEHRFTSHHSDLSHIVHQEPENHEGYARVYPSYEFSYNVDDPHTHDKKAQHEVREGDKVSGNYWLIQANGRKRYVRYHVDDESGFITVINYTSPHSNVYYNVMKHRSETGKERQVGTRQESKNKNENEGQGKDGGIERHRDENTKIKRVHNEQSVHRDGDHRERGRKSEERRNERVGRYENRGHEEGRRETQDKRVGKDSHKHDDHWNSERGDEHRDREGRKDGESHQEVNRDGGKGSHGHEDKTSRDDGGHEVKWDTMENERNGERDDVRRNSGEQKDERADGHKVYGGEFERGGGRDGRQNSIRHPPTSWPSSHESDRYRGHTIRYDSGHTPKSMYVPKRGRGEQRSREGQWDAKQENDKYREGKNSDKWEEGEHYNQNLWAGKGNINVHRESHEKPFREWNEGHFGPKVEAWKVRDDAEKRGGEEKVNVRERNRDDKWDIYERRGVEEEKGGVERSGYGKSGGEKIRIEGKKEIVERRGNAEESHGTEVRRGGQERRIEERREGVEHYRGHEKKWNGGHRHGSIEKWTGDGRHSGENSGEVYHRNHPLHLTNYRPIPYKHRY